MFLSSKKYKILKSKAIQTFDITLLFGHLLKGAEYKKIRNSSFSKLVMTKYNRKINQDYEGVIT